MNRLQPYSVKFGTLGPVGESENSLNSSSKVVSEELKCFKEILYTMKKT